MTKNLVFYQMILELSEEKNKSFNAIERELSYPRNALSNYKTGVIPSADRLLELANYFDVEPQYLLYRTHTSSIKSDYNKVEEALSQLNFQDKIKIAKKSMKWLSNLTISLEENISIFKTEGVKNEKKN